MSPPRKLAEIWEVDGDVHLRVEVGAFQHQVADTPAKAEGIAFYEVIQVLRKIVTDADGGTLELRSDSTLPPPDRPGLSRN